MRSHESAAYSPSVADYCDLDPVMLASLRTPADEDAIVAALEVQLVRQSRAIRRSTPVIPLQRRANEELRAA